MHKTGSGVKKCIALLSLFIIFTGPYARAQQETRLELVLGDVSLNKLPFVMAYEEGIYKQNGLDLTPVFTRSSGGDHPA